MRFFANDAVPGLALAAHELPEPWVLPFHLPRRHRDRLVGLLGRALAGFEPGLRLVELRWAERTLLDEPRLRLPRKTLVWWRIDETQTAAPVEIVREAARRWPGPAIYDFQRDDGLPAQGWLGALKLAVLYRLLDVLHDERPVREVERIDDLLREAASKIASPVDLLDFAEVLIEHAAVRADLAAARAQAFARILSARFDEEPGLADGMIQLLVALAAGRALPDQQRVQAHRVGLVDASGAVLTLADTLGERELARQVVLHLVARHKLSAPLRELAPGWFSRDQDVGDRDARVPMAADRGALITAVVETLERLSEGAERAARQSRPEEVEKQVRSALQALSSSRSPAERKAAATQVKRSADLLGQIGGTVGGPAAERIAALYQTAAENFREVGQIREATAAFVQEGNWRLQADQRAEGEAAFAHAGSLADAVRDVRLRAQSLFGLGRARFARQDLVGAQEAYEAAHSCFQELGEPLGEANTRRALGNLYLRTARLKEAEDSYQQALSRFQAIGSRLGEAYTRQALGDLYQRTDRLKEAEDSYQEALSRFQAIDDRLGEANTRQALGDLYQRTARLKEAEDSYQQALSRFQAIDSRLGEANTRRALGDLYQRTARLKEAEDSYQQALSRFQAIDERLGEANTRQALGDLYLRTARLQEAEDSYQQALSRFQAIDDRLGEANTRKALGDLYLRTARLQEAEDSYQQALSRFQAIDARLGEANTLRCLARLSYLTGIVVPDEQWVANIHRAQEISDSHGEWLTQTLRAAASFRAEPSRSRATWTAAHRYFEESGLRLEAVLTQALLHMASGESRQRILDYLCTQLGEEVVAPLRAAATQDQDSMIRGIINLLPTS